MGSAMIPKKRVNLATVSTDFELKANIMFANFEIKEPADLLLVYCMLYIVLCLKRVQKCINKERGVQEVFTLALEKFAIPG